MEGDAHRRGLRQETAEDNRTLWIHGDPYDLFVHPVHRGQRAQAGRPHRMGGVIGTVLRQLVPGSKDQQGGRTGCIGRRDPGKDGQLRIAYQGEQGPHGGDRRGDRRFGVPAFATGTGRRNGHRERHPVLQGDKAGPGGDQDHGSGHGRRWSSRDVPCGRRHPGVHGFRYLGAGDYPHREEGAGGCQGQAGHGG